MPEPSAGELLTRFSAVPDALKTGEQAAFSLGVSNQGTDEEGASVTVNVPTGLVVAPGSVAATSGQAHLNVFDRSITWQGILKAGESVTITFDAIASTMSGQVDVAAKVVGMVRGTETRSSVPVWINTARAPVLIFAPLVTDN